jgi:dCTP diphosphatase
MADELVTVAELRAAVARFSEERDWGQYHCPRNLAMALSVEAAELLALYLWSRDEGPQPPVPSRQPAVADEIADVAICLFGLCNRAGIDLSAAMADKMSRNALKYPFDLSRGRLEKSSELAPER